MLRTVRCRLVPADRPLGRCKSLLAPPKVRPPPRNPPRSRAPVVLGGGWAGGAGKPRGNRSLRQIGLPGSRNEGYAAGSRQRDHHSGGAMANQFRKMGPDGFTQIWSGLRISVATPCTARSVTGWLTTDDHERGVHKLDASVRPACNCHIPGHHDTTSRPCPITGSPGTARSRWRPAAAPAWS